MGWLGETKVSCILRHWGVQLILAYNLARPAILAAGKGIGGMFLFLLFLYFHSFSSFSPVSFICSTIISSVSVLPFSERQHKMTYKGWCVVKPQHKQTDQRHPPCLCRVDSPTSTFWTGPFPEGVCGQFLLVPCFMGSPVPSANCRPWSGWVYTVC